jgi:hypothetical protein
VSKRKAVVAVTAIGFGLLLSGCAGFRANPEDCSAIGGYVKEIVALQNATNDNFADNSYRRAGIKLWVEKLDELETSVHPRETELKEALSNWIATSRGVADELRPNVLDIDTDAVNKTANQFQSANQALGSMCSF